MDDWPENVFLIVAVLLMVAFTGWLLIELLSSLATVGWMMMR
jgi:hypothetical protein